MMHVLILGLGGNVSQGILKAVRASSLECRAVGACVTRAAAGLYLCDAACISPYASDAAFVPWLIDICERERIDAVLSGVEEVLDVIAEHREQLESRLAARFIISGGEALRTGGDKLETCRWLRRNNCAYPRFAASEDADALRLLAEQTGYRLIAKPRRGKGAQGIFRVRAEEDLHRAALLRDYVVQEEIGTERDEYTVACYADKHGSLVDMIVMHRELTNGTTSRATVAFNRDIEREAAAICSALKPTGPLNVQLRLNADERPVCFELNVRFSGTAPMRARFGFNDVEAALREHVLGEDISGFFSVRPGTALRYWEEVYPDAGIEETLSTSGAVAVPPALRG